MFCVYKGRHPIKKQRNIVIVILIGQGLMLLWQIYTCCFWWQKIQREIVNIFQLSSYEKNLMNEYIFRAIKVPSCFFFASGVFAIIMFLWNPTKLGGFLILSSIIGLICVLLMGVSMGVLD